MLRFQYKYNMTRCVGAAKQRSNLMHVKYYTQSSIDEPNLLVFQLEWQM